MDKSSDNRRYSRKNSKAYQRKRDNSRFSPTNDLQKIALLVDDWGFWFKWRDEEI